MSALHPVLRRAFDALMKAPREPENPPAWLEERVIAGWREMAGRDFFAPHRFALACGCGVALLSAACAVGIFVISEHSAFAMANMAFCQLLRP